MARITWQNVDAPDLSTSLAALTQFGGFLDKGLTRAQQTLTGIEDDRASEAARLLALNSAKFTDAATLEAALADGTLFAGIDTGSLKAEDITGASDRVGTLLGDDIRQNALDFLTYGQLRSKDTDARRDAAAPVMARLLDAYDRDDQEEIKNIRAQHGDLLGSLRYEDVFAANKALEDATNTGLDQVSSRLGNKKESWGFDRTVEDYTNQTTAADLAAGALRAGMDPESWRSALMNNPKFTAANGRVQNMVIDMVNQRAGTNIFGDYAPPSSDGGSSGGGGLSGPVNMGQAQSTVQSTLSSGGLSAPVVAGFLGNFDVEGGYGGAQGDGGTASGIAQWRKERRDAFKKRNGGKDPHQATVEEQANHVLWELNTPEGRAVAGLKDWQAEAIKNAKTPGEAAELIDKYYERSDGTHRRRRIAAAQQFFDPIAARAASTAQTSEARTDSSAGAVISKYGDITSIDELATKAKSDGLLPDVSRASLARSIGNLVEASRVDGSPKLNPAQALQILLDNRTAKGKTPVDNFFGRWVAWEDGSKLDWDQAGIARAVDKAKKGGYEDTDANLQAIEEAQAAVDRARAAETAARAQFSRFQQRLISQPELKPMVDKYAALVAAAEQARIIAEDQHKRLIGPPRGTGPRSGRKPVSEQRGAPDRRTGPTRPTQPLSGFNKFWNEFKDAFWVGSEDEARRRRQNQGR